ncbi:MAG: mandelate racemase/muconate lactonizing enzyme family protein [Anaerolineae bacterium]
MQITHVEVVPVELDLHVPYPTIEGVEVGRVGAVFVRIETQQGDTAWGCTAVDPAFTDVTLEEVTRACRACAARARDLNPINIEYALAELEGVAGETRMALCAFDLAFYDLLGLAARLPLYRLLGGYRQRIQTSITVHRATVQETVALARDYARQGFRILKIKSSHDPEEDVHRMSAVRDALPDVILRLDVEGGYTIQQTLDVARMLEGKLEMIEQPTPADDLEALREVTQRSAVPILADESVAGLSSALEIAGQRAAHGINVKLAACGGLHCARQMDAIARAAHLATMVGCVHEPALLAAAGLGFALSSSNVQYSDLDGYMHLGKDPTRAGFYLEDGWLYARDVPGLGCQVEL